MTNKQYAEFTKLCYEGGVRMEPIFSYGGPLGTYTFEYTIFIPQVQKIFAGEDLYNFDGIHQYDFGDFVGTGDSLEEAWEMFIDKNAELINILNLLDDPEDWTSGVSRYIAYIKEKYEF